MTFKSIDVSIKVTLLIRATLIANMRNYTDLWGDKIISRITKLFKFFFYRREALTSVNFSL